MKPKTLTITIIAFLVVIGLFIWGRANQKSTIASLPGTDGTSIIKSALVASETLHDFGTISMKNGNVDKEFTLTNPTSVDITISSVATSCMCTTAFIVGSDGVTKGPFGMPSHGTLVPPANKVLKAGEELIVRVVYDPNAHGPAGVGPIDRFITITEKTGDTLELKIKGLVTP